jgi:DNA-binding response OmpR family regulator
VRRLAAALRRAVAGHHLPALDGPLGVMDTATDEELIGLAAGVVQAARAASIAPVDGEGNHRVLIVDDDAALQQVLQRALTAPGRSVSPALSLAAADEEITRATPSLILLDLVLGDGDGRNFLVKLREGAATASVPVVVMSALRSAQVRSECYALGCEAFLDKPVDVHAMIATVSSLLERRAQPARPAAAATATRRVLLAEDDPVIAALVQHRLSRDGYEVTHVKNGLDALDHATRERFAIAILDVNMPGLSGFGLLEKLRQQPTLAAMPIMMLTAMGNESDVARALELGANDYVVKPFSPVELLARVRRLVTAPRPTS